MATKRISWTDGLRGLCMLSILLMHTEVYYAGDNIVNYNLYMPCTLNLFFFISGYFFHKEGTFSIRHKLASVARGLVLPYFIFTLAMALPKALAHGTGCTEALLSVFTGRASWFVAALIVAEALFSAALHTSRGKQSALCVASLACFCLAIQLSELFPRPWWQATNALLAFPLLHLGYTYHQKEKALDRLTGPGFTSALLILFLLTKIHIQTGGVSLLVCPIDISSFPTFALDALTSIMLFTTVAKRLPPQKWLEWTGRHSLAIYFACGAAPLLTAALFNRVGLAYDGSYARVLLAFVVACLATSAFAWAVHRYLPFAVGRWKR